VVTNSPSLLFSMNYSLHDLGLVERAAVPGWVEHSAVFGVAYWAPSDLAGKEVVLLARGVNANLGEETDRTEKWLADRCVLRTARQLVPDSGYALKARFFPAAGQQPYRIALREYDCSRVGSEL